MCSLFYNMHLLVLKSLIKFKIQKNEKEIIALHMHGTCEV